MCGEPHGRVHVNGLSPIKRHDGGRLPASRFLRRLPPADACNFAHRSHRQHRRHRARRPQPPRARVGPRLGRVDHLVEHLAYPTIVPRSRRSLALADAPTRPASRPRSRRAARRAAARPKPRAPRRAPGPPRPTISDAPRLISAALAGKPATRLRLCAGGRVARRGLLRLLVAARHERSAYARGEARSRCEVGRSEPEAATRALHRSSASRRQRCRETPGRGAGRGPRGGWLGRPPASPVPEEGEREEREGEGEGVGEGWAGGTPLLSAARRRTSRRRAAAARRRAATLRRRWCAWPE